MTMGNNKPLILISIIYLINVCQILEKVNSTRNDNEMLHWIFSEGKTFRTKRSSLPMTNCHEKFNEICNNVLDKNDELSFLECIQSLKPNEISNLPQKCQQESTWPYIYNITENKNIYKLSKAYCKLELDSLDCSLQLMNEHGSYLLCLIDKRDTVRDPRCATHIRRLEHILIKDYRIMTTYLNDCDFDIQLLNCIDGKDISCLQEHVYTLRPRCKKHISRVSELQADNFELDRQLYLACIGERTRFCPNSLLDNSFIYKCLMQHKMDKLMGNRCQKQLLRREKLIASDYKVSKGLVKACKEDIKINRCRRFVSGDKDIKLAQILLCLEIAIKNGTKVDRDCQIEMFDHRRMLMEDYRLSPEIVTGCANDIIKFCNNPKVGDGTIHCLMEHTESDRRKTKITSKCSRALKDLLEETDVGEDWRIDPVLHAACQPVVDSVCKDIQGGDARVISCLMEKLGTDVMRESCETALLTIQYFVARDFKLDPQLYRACKFDAVRFCRAGIASWNSTDGRPFVLPCLYNHAYHPQKNVTLKSNCLGEIRRVMRQRAVSVHLQPEIEEVCLNELSTFCNSKTAKGEEIICLQDNLENLSKSCKYAVGNLTEEQAERVELNPIMREVCRHIIERYCEEIWETGKDDGDVMECLIEHKRDLVDPLDQKCKTSIEHFQLISLKDYHFTSKFKKACKTFVDTWCRNSHTKSDVIECLHNLIQEDIFTNKAHRISGSCRHQITAQLFQQHENIEYDPRLHKSCLEDIERSCKNVANSQIIECLAQEKSKLTNLCHKELFKVRKEQFQDTSTDYVLLTTCRNAITQFCHNIEPNLILNCLKNHEDESTFDSSCKSILMNRMIERNTDYRFNPILIESCSLDIEEHCKQILMNEPTDKELQGKIVQCLRIQFRQSKLNNKCERELTKILREAALNYHLNPLLATMCAREIKTLCKPNKSDPSAVEECLKLEFSSNNKFIREGCRLEIADLINEDKADIHVDPLLHKACALDVNQFCSDVPRGAGRHITCLQNVMQDTKKSLQAECEKMLNTRMDMFRSLAQERAPENLDELYTVVSTSPSRRYFMILGLTIISLIFITGLFCGRATRRTMLMKNK